MKFLRPFEENKVPVPTVEDPYAELAVRQDLAAAEAQADRDLLVAALRAILDDADTLDDAVAIAEDALDDIGERR